MTLNIADLKVDDIVREVLAQIAGHKPTTATVQPEPNSTKSKETKPDPRPTTDIALTDIVLTEKVISVLEVSSRLAGAKRVVVRPKAIVTPAARDWLRERRVELVFDSDTKGSGGSNQAKNDKPAAAKGSQPTRSLALAVANMKFDSSSLVRALARDGIQTEQLARVGLTGTIDELGSLVGRGSQLGWLLTGEVAAAACLANRQRGVRAAVAATAGDVREAIRSLGVNLLVVNPASQTFWQLLNMGRAFLGGGPRECPAEFAQRLV
jgi:hypothetical protein